MMMSRAFRRRKGGVGQDEEDESEDEDEDEDETEEEWEEEVQQWGVSRREPTFVPPTS